MKMLEEDIWYSLSHKFDLSRVTSFIEKTAERYSGKEIYKFPDYLRLVKKNYLLGGINAVLRDAILGLITRRIIFSIDPEKIEFGEIARSLYEAHSKIGLFFSFWITRLLVSEELWGRFSADYLQMLSPALYYYYLSYRDKPAFLPHRLVNILVEGLSHYVHSPNDGLVKNFYLGLFIREFRRELIEKLILRIKHYFNEYNNQQSNSPIMTPYDDWALRGLTYALALKALEDFRASWDLDLSRILSARFTMEVLTKTMNLLAPLSGEKLDLLMRETLEFIEALKSYSIVVPSNGANIVRISNIYGRNPQIYRKYRNRIERLITKPKMFMVLDVLMERIIVYESAEAIKELKELTKQDSESSQRIGNLYELVRVYLGELEI